ncbi:MAG: hypothetical protein ABSB88_06535 [Bryobacteraceae bacterium]|jgi:uncharacterized protein (TIGR03437 family)
MPCDAAGFGTVAAIGGHAADIALDEARGVLYIANYTANRIDVLSTADNTVHTSVPVSPQPGSLALSPDGQYLLVACGPTGDLFQPSYNLLTLIHLPIVGGTQQTFGTPDVPLGVAFFNTQPSGPGLALVVTTTEILTLDPTNGVLSPVATFASLVTSLPVPIPTFPGQILQTALTTSADKLTIWGVADTGTQPEIVYVFNARTGYVSATSVTAAPALLPRVSVAADGSYATVGYLLLSAPAPLGPYCNIVILGRYPNTLASTNVTGHAIDSKNNLVYAQIPDVTQPVGPPYTSTTTSAGSTSSAGLPTILLMDADNLTVRDRILIPENMVGRAVLNAAATVLYAISDSGVMVLPVGSLNSYHRLASSQEDVLLQTTFCNRSPVSQPLTITDPGGGHTDFTITPSQPGVTIVPSFGTTPATVQVLIDPTKFPALGTTVVTLALSSTSAINVPKAVRLLVNNPDVNQRGTIVDVPGVLTDILPDTVRNRFYILRQDLNQLQIFDGASNQRTVALRTATTPTKMSFTIDGKYMLVGHNDSQLVTRYDLDQMLRVGSVVMPPGHFVVSVAQSNALLAALARDESSPDFPGVIDSIDPTFSTPACYGASALGTLGIWKNEDPTYLPGMLAPSPNGRSILFATANGKAALYSADANTFTVGRQDFTSLSGAVAASIWDTYVIGNNVLNASLVPQGTLDPSYGTSAGFSFTGQGGYRMTALSASSPGVIQNLPALIGSAVQPTLTTESPILSTTTNPFTRTVAPMTPAGTVIAMTVSGFTVLSANYAAATAPPSISKVVSAADGSAPVAAGELISVYGSQMSPVNIATSQIPLPTALGESCLVVNGTPIPLLFVSSGQINAQLPFNLAGNATMSIHTPAGISNNYNFTINGAAPSIFMSGTAGPETGLATVVRADDGQLVTPTNPIHYGDTIVIYLTGMGTISPAVSAGLAAPMSPLSFVTDAPTLTLGGSPLTLLYAGLVPGYISGLYQINATVPFGVTQGLSIPLVINQGGGSTTLYVRVVN